MRNKLSRASRVALLEGARYEVLPTASTYDRVLEHVPAGRTLTITASVGKGLEATLALAEALSVAGYRAVPHLAARMIHGPGELAEIVARLHQSGVDSVFVPAGDADPPLGPYDSSLLLLQDLTGLGTTLTHIGVAGYPESHPTIHDDVVIQAMWDKRHHATHVVSNLCFDARVVAAWVDRVRSRGLDLPILIGMPGPVERAKLLSMATKIGVGESTRFLAKNKATFARIASPGGYSAGRFLTQLEPVFARPGARIEGIHLFTFNQIAETERWRRSMIAALAEA